MDDDNIPLVPIDNIDFNVDFSDSDGEDDLEVQVEEKIKDAYKNLDDGLDVEDINQLRINRKKLSEQLESDPEFRQKYINKMEKKRKDDLQIVLEKLQNANFDYSKKDKIQEKRGKDPKMEEKEMPPENKISKGKMLEDEMSEEKTRELLNFEKSGSGMAPVVINNTAGGIINMYFYS